MSKNYVELKISDLREQCQKRSLESSGLKVHLVERLKKHDRDIENAAKAAEEKKIMEKKAEEQIKIVKIVEVEKIDEKINKSINIENEPKIIIKTQNLSENAQFEPENWENRIDVHLDYYHSDLNMIIDQNGFEGRPLAEKSFEYLFSGVKSNFGVKKEGKKVFFELKVIKKLCSRHFGSDFGESSVILVGWSANHTSLSLGDEILSFGYEGVGKKVANGVSVDYGVPLKEGDIIGCFLEFTEDNFIISFSVNGVSQGEAFTTSNSELKDDFLLPHIYVRNISFEVNFGNDKEALFPPKTSIEGDVKIDDLSWKMIGKLDIDKRERADVPPKTKGDCEVLMMCGLPSCGKTTWVENMIKNRREKFYNVLSMNTILDKMKVSGLRKKCAGSRWDAFIVSATECLNKLMEIAVTRRRNFILDQTNVYPAAQRRRMKTFEEFIRKAIIIVPTDDEYQRRKNQVITEEGKDVPESAVLQLKENFVIPGENNNNDDTKLFNEIVFVELQRAEAEELVKKYNEEAKSKKKAAADEQNSNSNNNKRTEREDNSPTGLWGSSPKDEDLGMTSGSQPTAKKSRWNEDTSFEEKSSKPREKSLKDRYEEKSSKDRYEEKPSKDRYEERLSKDRYDDRSSTKSRYEDRLSTKDRYEDKSSSRFKESRGYKGSSSTSSSHTPKKTEYKGGFCFAREADDGVSSSAGNKGSESYRDRSRSSGRDRRGGEERRPSSDSRHHYDDQYRSERGPPSTAAHYESPRESQPRQQPSRGGGGVVEYGGRLPPHNSGGSYGASEREGGGGYQLGRPISRGGGSDVRGGSSRGRGGGGGGDVRTVGGYQKYGQFPPEDKPNKSNNYQDYPSNQHERQPTATPSYGGRGSSSSVSRGGGGGGASKVSQYTPTQPSSSRMSHWGGSINFDGTPQTDTAFGPSSKYTSPYRTQQEEQQQPQQQQEDDTKFINPYTAVKTTPKYTNPYKSAANQYSANKEDVYEDYQSTYDNSLPIANQTKSPAAMSSFKTYGNTASTIGTFKTPLGAPIKVAAQPSQQQYNVDQYNNKQQQQQQQSGLSSSSSYNKTSNIVDQSSGSSYSNKSFGIKNQYTDESSYGTQPSSSSYVDQSSYQSSSANDYDYSNNDYYGSANKTATPKSGTYNQSDSSSSYYNDGSSATYKTYSNTAATASAPPFNKGVPSTGATGAQYGAPYNNSNNSKIAAQYSKQTTAAPSSTTAYGDQLDSSTNSNATPYNKTSVAPYNYQQQQPQQSAQKYNNNPQSGQYNQQSGQYNQQSGQYNQQSAQYTESAAEQQYNKPYGYNDNLSAAAPPAAAAAVTPYEQQQQQPYSKVAQTPQYGNKTSAVGAGGYYNATTAAAAAQPSPSSSYYGSNIQQAASSSSSASASASAGGGGYNYNSQYDYYGQSGAVQQPSNYVAKGQSSGGSVPPVAAAPSAGTQQPPAVAAAPASSYGDYNQYYQYYGQGGNN